MASTLFLILTSLIAGCDLSVIKVDLHQDVLLPCIVAYNHVYRLDGLIINWQRSENDHVVHSFFDEKDQPEYQENEFKGRTQLFPEEFPKGNASLLLKNIAASDVGNYTCHVTLHDMNGYTPPHVELLVQEEEIYSSDEKHTGMWLWSLLLVPAVLIPAAIVIIVHRRKQRKHKPEEEEALLGTPDLYGSIESYRERVYSTGESCCKSASSGGKRDACLHRIFHTLSGKKLDTDSEYMFEEKDNTTDNIQSEDLFTVKTEKLISRRMLITGDAGIGKSCYSKGLQKHWASKEQELSYKCIIYITFNELNSFCDPISVEQLLIYKCPELSAVLTDLLNKDNLLLILDGLDEFKHKLKDNPSCLSCDIKTPLDIGTLVFKVISMQLLPNTAVLVTSRLSSARKIYEHFTSMLILEGFTDDQIKEYCEKFTATDDMSNSISDFIQLHQLFSLVSIPLLSSALCEMSKKTNFSQYKGTLSTCSRMMFSLLQCSVRATLTGTGDPDKMCFMTGKTEESKVPENIQNTIHQLCKISYNNLISGVQEVERKDLGVNCSQTEFLLKTISEFFFKADRTGDRFEYRHTSIRDMFAALYCVGEIQDQNHLKECLDAWVFGEISKNKNEVPLLENIPSGNCKMFHNFIRFFLGLLTYRKKSFLSELCPLGEAEKNFLQQWFKAWIERPTVKMHLLNLFHCVFELHDDDLTRNISQYIKNVNLFNVPLNALDIRTVLYCCTNTKPDTADLRLCKLGDVGLEKLKSIVENCTNVRLSSNKLTEKSAELLGRILDNEECVIEHLALGTNRLGTAGAKHLFKALEKNSSLKTLHLKDNHIDDSGTEFMVQSLKYNKTLKELHLCMNFFEQDGIKNIIQLRQDRPDLKLVVRIAEDVSVLRYVEEKVDGLFEKGWEQYDKTWLVQLLGKVQEDLKDDEQKNKHVQERVEIVKGKCIDLLQKITSNKHLHKI